MSQRISIPTEQVSAVRRELSRMESKRRWPRNRRFGGSAGQLQSARIQLGAAMLEAMRHGRPTITLDLGDATDLVFEALDRVHASAEHA
jgi:hypothetical protein